MKKKTATIENKIKLNTSIMATGNVNSFKKNWLIQFTGVTTGEIDYILSRIGSKTGDIAPGSRSGGIHVFPSNGSRTAG
jgi:hypothetical protein